MCFTGYRFFKAVMFLTGFIFTSVLVYLVLSQHSLLPVEGNIGVALGSGLLIGLLTMLVQYVGLFFTGFQLGAAIGVVSLIVVDLFVFIPIHWIRIGVICGAGLICAIVTLKFQKGGMILGTSVSTVHLGEVSPGRELDQPASLKHSPAPYTGSAQCAGIEGR